MKRPGLPHWLDDAPLRSAALPTGGGKLQPPSSPHAQAGLSSLWRLHAPGSPARVRSRTPKQMGNRGLVRKQTGDPRLGRLPAQRSTNPFLVAWSVMSTGGRPYRPLHDQCGRVQFSPCQPVRRAFCPMAHRQRPLPLRFATTGDDRHVRRANENQALRRKSRRHHGAWRTGDGGQRRGSLQGGRPARTRTRYRLKGRDHAKLPGWALRHSTLLSRRGEEGLLPGRSSVSASGSGSDAGVPAAEVGRGGSELRQGLRPSTPLINGRPLVLTPCTMVRAGHNA